MNGVSDVASRREGAVEDFFLPDICSVRSAFTLVVISELFAFIIVLARDTGLRPWFEDLALVSLFVQWITLASAAVLCLARRWLVHGAPGTAAAAAFVMILLTALGVSELAWWVVTAGGAAETLVGGSHRAFVLRTLGITTVVALVALRYFYVQQRWRLQTESESRARIEVLKARIRPHFLFNCMNTIASLTRVDPAAAEQAIEDLADLFRASLADADDTVPLADELALARQYLAIEKLRLGNRLAVTWQVDDDAADIRLPVLTLQPLLENAIYHGIEPLADGGEIGIRISREAGVGRITVSNPRDSAASPARQGNRQAQRNIAERLGAYFGERGTLNIERSARDYRVEVVVPVGTAG